MEFDNPAVGVSGWDGAGREHSDFSDGEKGVKEKKEKNILGNKKKEKEKKKRKRNTLCTSRR